MKFQSSAFTRIRLQIIPIILTATFLLLNSTPGQALWGGKIKKISNDELTEIKTELNLSQDSRFRAYSDSNLKETLDKEIDPQKTSGLTSGVFILNAIYEEKLVEMCYPDFYDEKSSRFFSLLADNLTSWQKNFAEKTTKIVIEAIIEAYKMHGLSIGISSLFLAVDLAQVGIGIIKLAEVVRNRALSFYLGARSRGDSHEVAWSVAGIPPLYDNWQTQGFFKSLWNKYEKYMSEDGLHESFKQQQRESLRVSLLYALGAQAHPILTSPLEIAPSASYYVGDTINAQFTITNNGTAPITFSVLTVGGRDPDAQIADFPFRRDITLHPDQYYNYKGALTLTNTGKYHFFCAYQTPDGNWNPSVDLGPGLTDKDRVKNVIVQLKEKPYLDRWKYRKKITIDHTKIDEDLTDFPVLVKLTSSNFDFLKVRTDGYDIRFTDAAGNTFLKYERERHDSGNDKAEYWVKIPSISKDTDTEFYIYYRATDAPDGENPTAVWDSNFKGVWHLKGLGDSTTNNNTLTNHGTTEVDGKIAKAKDFERDSSQYLSHADAPALSPTGDITIEFWVKHETLASNYYMTKWDETTNFDYTLYMTGGDKLRSQFLSDGDLSPGHETDTQTDTHQDTAWTGSDVGVWRHVALTTDVSGPTVAFYKDGLADTTTYLHINATSIHDGVTDFRIGSVYSSYYRKGAYADGVLDEIRLSHTARSVAWIKASYNSGNDSLLTYGSEEQNQNGNWELSTDKDRVKDIIVKEKGEISFKSFYYKDEFAEYTVKYPNWPVSPRIEELKVIEEQGGKGMAVVKSAEAEVGIGVFQLARRLPSGEYTVPLQKFIRETIRDAKKYRNLHSSIDLEEIKEEIGVSQILAEKISSDEDFIETIIDKNSEYFNTYAIELDGSKIHVYAETFHLKNGKDFIVVVNAIEDKWSDYRDIAEYIIDSMQVKVIGETGVKRRSPLSPIIQTVRSFYRALDVGDIDELQKHLSPKIRMEQFSIIKDINSLYSPILHHVITKMHTENLEVLHQSGIIVKPSINKEMLEYLAPSIDRIEIKEKQIEKTRNYEFANVSVKVILRPGARQECEAELKHLRDALEGNAPLLANQPINVPWNVLIAYFPENQKVRLERYNGKWKIVDITQLK